MWCGLFVLVCHDALVMMGSYVSRSCLDIDNYTLFNLSVDEVLYVCPLCLSSRTACLLSWIASKTVKPFCQTILSIQIATIFIYILSSEMLGLKVDITRNILTLQCNVMKTTLILKFDLLIFYFQKISMIFKFSINGYLWLPNFQVLKLLTKLLKPFQGLSWLDPPFLIRLV